MKKIVVLAVVSLACSIGMAAGDKAPTAQQKLMGTCTTEAAEPSVMAPEVTTASSAMAPSASTLTVSPSRWSSPVIDVAAVLS